MGWADQEAKVDEDDVADAEEVLFQWDFTTKMEKRWNWLD